MMWATQFGLSTFSFLRQKMQLMQVRHDAGHIGVRQSAMAQLHEGPRQPSVKAMFDTSGVVFSRALKKSCSRPRPES